MHACCSMLHSLKFDMQHDHVLKNELLTPRVSGGSAGKYFYQVAAFVIPFNLICNTTLL